MVSDAFRFLNGAKNKMKVGIFGDSTNFVYHVTPSGKKKHRNVRGNLLNKTYWDISLKLFGGSSPEQIFDEMVRDADYKTYNVVVCVISYNGTTDKKYQLVEEPVSLEQSMFRLTNKMRAAPRCILSAGGSAIAFGFSDNWDKLVSKYLRFCRDSGVATVSGAEFFENMAHVEGDDWHFFCR